MFLQILKFNLKYLSRQVVFYAAALVFIVLGFAGNFGNFGGLDINANAPYSVSFFLALLSKFMLFTVTIFAANIVLRDSDHKMEEIVYSTAISRFGYLAGNFGALFLVIFFILSAAAAAMFTGSFLVDESRLGPVNIGNYLLPLLVFGIPNILFCCAALFSVAILSRNAIATYVCGVLIYVLYMVGSILGNSPLMAGATPTGVETDLLPTLLDPFGLVGFMGEARHWTAAQRNALGLTLSGSFLTNRVFWSGLSLLVFGLIYRRFAFRSLTTSGKKKSLPKVPNPGAAKFVYRPEVTAFHRPAAQWQAFLSQTRIEILSLMKSLPLLVMSLLWIFLIGVELSESLFRGIFNTASYPTSGLIGTLIHEPLSKIGLFIVIFYGAELIHREKSVKFNQLLDATPASNSVFYFAKLSALTFLIFFFTTLAIVTGITIQAAAGYFRFEPMVYLSLFYYGAMPLLLVAVLALFVQSIIPNKYLAMVVLVGALVFIMRPRVIGFEHPLLRYAMLPELSWSDFNGYGQLGSYFNWLLSYWSAVAGLLMLAAWQLWPRGVGHSLWQRLGNIFIDWRKSHTLVAMTSLMLAIICGGNIYYYTNIVRDYRSITAGMDHQAAYEQKYLAYDKMTLPVISDVSMTIDLFPEEQRYQIEGAYRLINRSESPIHEILVGINPEVHSADITFTNGELLEYDPENKMYRYSAQPPMQPGDDWPLHFKIEVQKYLSVDVNYENSIVANGSYIEVEKFIPFLGYNADRELQDVLERKKRGLPAQQAPSGPEDASPAEYQWVNYEATISTTPAQKVVSVGRLQEQWIKNNRSYFHYKSDQPIAFMFGCASAEYQIRQAAYDDIAIEVYHLGQHDYNVQRMLSSAKQSLALHESTFSPYQYNHVRIVEIPNYPGAATAYPGTIFATERFCFLMDLRDANRIDFVTLLSGHELAHQWWGYQIEPQYVAGAKILTETLAQYSELLMLEKYLGKGYLRDYLSNERDMYLNGRAYSRDEPPLYRSAGREQSHLQYQKGSLVMYALKDYLGEAKLNAAIRNFLAAHRYPKQRPTTLDLLEHLYAVADSGQAGQIDHWMKEIVFYDLKIDSATVRQSADGRYRVSLTVSAGKYRQQDGADIPLPLQEAIEIAILAQHPDINGFQENLLLLEKKMIGEKPVKFEFTVDREPEYVCIDPYLFHIDLNRADNYKKLKQRRQ